MAYKIIINKRNGRKMCYKDGKLIKEKDIPEELLKDEPIPEPIEEPEPPKKCVFDGMPVEYQRQLWHNGKSVEIYLCGHCYFSKTLGELKAYLNKK